VRRGLARLGIEASELATPHAVEARLARARMPESVRTALDGLRADVTARLDAMRPSDHLVPGPAIDGARNAMHHRIARLERRFVAALKRADDEAARDLATASGALFPLGKRQERALNAVPLLARHGPALLDAMLDRARAHAESLVTRGRAPLPGDV
jgi:hypothetical protein